MNNLIIMFLIWYLITILLTFLLTKDMNYRIDGVTKFNRVIFIITSPISFPLILLIDIFTKKDQQ